MFSSLRKSALVFLFLSGTALAAPRNVIIFVADGLRHDSVNAADTPTLSAVRAQGVHFVNSHSLYPTLTTPNASAIATGHYLGDTGDFSNAEYVGYPTFNTGNFGKTANSPTPFLENDLVLGDVSGHAVGHGGNFLAEESLLALARQHGFNTAAIGKLGPVAIQDITELQPVEHHFSIPRTLILDDSTGSASGVPLSPEIQKALADAGLGATPTVRDQPTGTAIVPGTLKANVGQQQWFADAATKVVLPAFARGGRPFVLLFWSRDPDGSQHNEGDSLNKLQPGINGATSKAGVANADANLKQLLDYLDANPAIKAGTDVFVTSDHGFATISRHEIDAAGHATKSYAATLSYADVMPGFLPPGFLAIDLAHALGLPLFDPDAVADGRFAPVDPGKKHPRSGGGLIGGTGVVQDHVDAKLIVSASGGTDLIYIPDEDKALARKVVAFLTSQDYVGALFVDPGLGGLPGTLPLAAVNLRGAALMPRPSIVVAFKSFELQPGSVLSAIQVSDTTLQEGQGMHGGFGRDSTYNNMAAIGPDFKRGFTDTLPVSNADIMPTLAHVLGLTVPAAGELHGRLLSEALAGGKEPARAKRATQSAVPAKSGFKTVLHYQEYDGRRYFDSASSGEAR